jgi:demethylmenaquinone methyltransferase/2-methoxy-6-polyprenyl-1,4-benzoquinol methylase
MLRVGLEKTKARGLTNRVTLVRGDAARIPAASGVHAVTVAFGIRNVQTRRRACDEMHRVLTSGGRLAVLEFAIPTTPGIRALSLVFQAGAAAHREAGVPAQRRLRLPAGVSWRVCHPDEFVKILRQSGFDEIRAVPLTFGHRLPVHGQATVMPACAQARTHTDILPLTY